MNKKQIYLNSRCILTTQIRKTLSNTEKSQIRPIQTQNSKNTTLFINVYKQIVTKYLKKINGVHKNLCQTEIFVRM